MLDIMKANRFYLIGYFILFSIGICLLTQIEQGDIIFYFSEIRSEGLDMFFKISTALGEAIGYLLAAIIFLFIRFRYSILMGITAASVGISAAILKSIFRHPRPKPYFQELGQDISDIAVSNVPLLESKINSFPSGHTLSGFAFFTVLALITRYKSLKFIFLIIAFFVGLSRVYLVHHFLEDIVFGSFCGVLLAYCLFHFHNKLPYENEKWYNKKLQIKVV
jgi:membrane-associated phospholipid phosphatase